MVKKKKKYSIENEIDKKQEHLDFLVEKRNRKNKIKKKGKKDVTIYMFDSLFGSFFLLLGFLVVLISMCLCLFLLNGVITVNRPGYFIETVLSGVGLFLGIIAKAFFIVESKIQNNVLDYDKAVKKIDGSVEKIFRTLMTMHLVILSAYTLLTLYNPTTQVSENVLIDKVENYQSINEDSYNTYDIYSKKTFFNKYNIVVFEVTDKDLINTDENKNKLENLKEHYDDSYRNMNSTNSEFKGNKYLATDVVFLHFNDEDVIYPLSTVTLKEDKKSDKLKMEIKEEGFNKKVNIDDLQ